MRKISSTILSLMLLLSITSNGVAFAETNTETPVMQSVQYVTPTTATTSVSDNTDTSTVDSDSTQEGVEGKTTVETSEDTSSDKETTTEESASEKTTTKEVNNTTSTVNEEKDTTSSDTKTEDSKAVEETTEKADDKSATEETKTTVKEETKKEEATKEEDKKEEEKEEDPNVKDISDRVEKNGINVTIAYSEDGGITSYIPRFTLALRTGTGKVVSTIEAGPQNYNAATQTYDLVFPNKNGYKLDDDFQLYLSNADSMVKKLEMYVGVTDKDGNYKTYVTTLGVGNYFKFTVGLDEYYASASDEEKEKITRDIQPSKSNPLKGSLFTDSSKVGFYLLTSSGAPVKNTKLTVTTDSNEYTITSDSRGIAWINSSSLSQTVYLSSEGNSFAESNRDKLKYSLPAYFSADSQSSTVILPVTLVVGKTYGDADIGYGADEDNSSNGNKSGNVDLDYNTKGKMDLSKQWTMVDLVLTNKDGKELTITVDHTIKSLGNLEDGTYSVKAKAEYANVQLSSSTLTVKDGKGKLSLTASPMYTLQVDKDGESFKFKVLNVEGLEGKVYSGKDPITFAVTAGESFMIQDVASGEVYTVAIDTNSKVTRLVLGAGVVYGGSATAPHTGDIIYFLVAIFVLALAGVAVSYYYHRKGKLVLATPTLSPEQKQTIKKGTNLFMVLLMLGGLLQYGAGTANAAAGTGSGTGGSVGSVGGVSSGIIKASDTVSVLQVSIIDGKKNNSVQLAGDSSKTELSDAFKFDKEYAKNALFMASNSTNRNAFLHSGSSYGLFNNSNGTVTRIMGKDTLGFGDSLKSNGVKGTMSSRMMKAPESAKNSNNYLEKFMGYAMTYLNSSENSGRQLWKDQNNSSGLSPSVSNKNIGDILDSQFASWLGKQSGVGDLYDKENKDLNMAKLFESYISKMRSVGQNDVADALEANIASSIDSKGNSDYILLFQVVQGFEPANARGSKGYLFMPMSDSTKWYKYYREKSSSAMRNVNDNEEAKILYGVSGDNGTTDYQKQAPTYTFTANARNGTGVALKPKTSKVPIAPNTSSGVKTNPFTGWGYFNLRNLEEYTIPQIIPEVKVQLKVNVKKSGKTVKTITKPLTLYNGKDTANLYNVYPTDILTGEMLIDNLYQLDTGSKATVNIVDNKDKENINKSTMKKSTKGKDTTFKLPNSVNERWKMVFEDNVADTLNLHYYLGGSGTTSSVEKKYSNGKSSNATLTITVNATEVDREEDSNKKASLTVPQWKIGQYDSNIASGSDYAKATYLMSFDAESFINPKITNGGWTQLRTTDADLSKTPYIYKASTTSKDSLNTYLSAFQKYKEFRLTSNVLAYRDSSIGQNINLANWVNNFSLYGGNIQPNYSTKTGSGNVTKSTTLKMSVRDDKDHKYKETRSKWVDKVEYVNGKWSLGYSKDYTYEGKVTKDYTDASYKLSVAFKKYNTASTKAHANFKNDSGKTSTSYWEAKQGSKILKIVPEVFMSYDDTQGNTSGVFVVGEKAREIKPVHYNTMEMKDMNIATKVTGLTTATEVEAKELASRLKTKGASVAYKGSPITGNMEVEGDLVLKTYALDIGSSALKNAWGNSSYSTDAVNEEFLSRNGKKGEDGKYTMQINSTAKLKINGKEYGGQNKKLTAKQKDTSVKEHKVVVRGGKVVSVDGTAVSKLSADMKKVLEGMKLSTSDNIFSSFVSNAGDKLSDSKTVKLGNAMRGTSDLSTSKNWYNEDTTVLVIREYTNTFELPDLKYSDKIPMEIPGLEAPMDKLEFFSKGYKGYVTVNYATNDLSVKYDSSEAGEVNYIVPNVSVVDTMRQ